MFAFTKEQKQAKLARTNVDNYNKLYEQLQKCYSNDLQREAISNAMADIVDIFTLLRSSYDLSKPFKTIEDYRLLRVPGMPGIVMNYKWYGSEIIIPLYPYYSDHIKISKEETIKPYLALALKADKIRKAKLKYENKANKYGITLEFSDRNFDTLLNLEKFIHLSSTIRLVTSNYTKELCIQFAYKTKLDIFISI